MSKPSSVEDAAGEEQLMLDVLRAQMDCEGVSEKLKSQIRISILKMLGHSIAQSEADGGEAKPAITDDLAVVNSLVKEYLEWVGYTFSSLMISSESSSNDCPSEMSRCELQSILKLEAIGKQNPDLPLLYIIVEQLKRGTPS
ncbi:FOP N terminal dimerisation domain [Nesidiocoris tenuis]|uniref:FOP N terminal dimerisation domain n=1 Tax=Nesidiocoris tenuis TaxID=355587 RepID=A0ABN7B3B4_9HEMI|nr:FOP N terminal dimerisation domain [Nesidiocoris tenuis]